MFVLPLQSVKNTKLALLNLCGKKRALFCFSQYKGCCPGCFWKFSPLILK